MFLAFCLFLRLRECHPFSLIFLSDLLCFLFLYFYVFPRCCLALIVTCVALFHYVCLFLLLVSSLLILSFLSVDLSLLHVADLSILASVLASVNPSICLSFLLSLF